MRLIDADKLKCKLYGFERFTGIDEAPYEYAEAVINKEPTIDAVPVIRCKDCKHGLNMYDDKIYCMRRYREGMTYVGKWDNYCSLAERKEE